RYWYETFALRSMPVEEVDRRFSLDGLEHVDAALAAGRGIILALPHMGNWDAAGHWLCVNGYRMTAVAEELKPPEVCDLFLRHRRITPPIEPERPGSTRQAVTTLTVEVSRQFERFIAAAPVDWHMFQPAWDLAEPEADPAAVPGERAPASAEAEPEPEPRVEPE